MDKVTLIACIFVATIGLVSSVEQPMIHRRWVSVITGMDFPSLSYKQWIYLLTGIDLPSLSELKNDLLSVFDFSNLSSCLIKQVITFSLISAIALLGCMLYRFKDHLPSIYLPPRKKTVYPYQASENSEERRNIVKNKRDKKCINNNEERKVRENSDKERRHSSKKKSKKENKEKESNTDLRNEDDWQLTFKSYTVVDADPASETAASKPDTIAAWKAIAEAASLKEKKKKDKKDKTEEKSEETFGAKSESYTVVDIKADTASKPTIASWKAIAKAAYLKEKKKKGKKNKTEDKSGETSGTRSKSYTVAESGIASKAPVSQPSTSQSDTITSWKAASLKEKKKKVKKHKTEEKSEETSGAKSKSYTVVEAGTADSEASSLKEKKKKDKKDKTEEESKEASGGKSNEKVGEKKTQKKHRGDDARADGDKKEKRKESEETKAEHIEEPKKKDKKTKKAKPKNQMEENKKGQTAEYDENI